MAITFDNASSTASATTPITLSHATGDFGKRILLVGVGIRGAVTVSSITYNSIALTKIDSVQPGGDVRAELWYLFAPTVGSNNVVVTMSGNQNVIVGAVTYYNIGGLGDSSTNSGIDNPVSVVVTSDTGELVVDVYADQSSGYEPSVDAGQTERINYDHTDNDLAMSDKAGASSVTMSWTLGGPDTWAMVATALKPATYGRSNDIVPEKRYIIRETRRPLPASRILAPAKPRRVLPSNK